MGERNRKPPSDADLAELFRDHASGLAGAVRGILGPKADHQEILQEAFLRAWKARANGVRAADPVAWVFVITLNLARDARRRTAGRGPEIELEEVNAVELRAKEPEPVARLASGEALAAAREAIYRLKEDEKEVFLLRVSAEQSFAAIASALDIPIGTAKSRMRAALRELRIHLKAFDPETFLQARGVTR